MVAEVAGAAIVVGTLVAKEVAAAAEGGAAEIAAAAEVVDAGVAAVGVAPPLSISDSKKTIPMTDRRCRW